MAKRAKARIAALAGFMERRTFYALVRQAGFEVIDSNIGTEEAYVLNHECTGACERLAALVLAQYVAEVLECNGNGEAVAELKAYFLRQIRPHRSHKFWNKLDGDI